MYEMSDNVKKNCMDDLAHGKASYSAPECELVLVNFDSSILAGSGFKTDDWERDDDIIS